MAVSNLARSWSISTILRIQWRLIFPYTCVLSVDVFNGCSLLRLKKYIKRLRKEIKRLLSKGNVKKNTRESKIQIPHTVLEQRTLCLSSYKNRKLKVTLWWVEHAKEKRGHFLYRLFCPVYGVLNTLSEYTYISKNIPSYTFLLVFKIVEILQCILKAGLPPSERNSFYYTFFFYKNNFIKTRASYLTKS